MSFRFRFLKSKDYYTLSAPSEHVAYIYGLFLEGCKFDLNKSILDDSDTGVMFCKAPIIDFIPTTEPKNDDKVHSMAVYKTNIRAGTLSTTGHSTNFIISIDTPTKKKPEYWILKGAAYCCAMND